MDRETRRIQNTKQPSMEFQGKPSLNNMVEGQFAVEKQSNSQLAIYRKKFGQMWKSYMSSNGDQIVDRQLTANSLKYTNRFIDYRYFIHNFEEDITTREYYLPWAGTGEADEMSHATTGFLAPFKMTLKKIMIRCDNLNGSDDIVIKVEKEDADSTEDTVATATYDVSEMGSISSYNSFELNISDFDNTPTIEAGKKAGLSIQANSDITDSIAHFWITSVWRIEVTV